MSNLSPLPGLLKRLWAHINERRRSQFWMLTSMSLLSSFGEVLSIGAVFPFLASLTNPNHLFELKVAQPAIHFLNITAPNQLLFPLTLIFCSAVLMAAVMRLRLLWANTRFSYATGADLSLDFYRRTLYQSYAIHCSRNSSEVISGIIYKVNGVISNTIAPIMTLINSIVIMVAILTTLLLFEPVVTLSAFGGMALIYTLTIRFTRKKILDNGKLIALKSDAVIKSLQEGLGGIRDVLIDGNQEIYSKIYSDADLQLRRAQGDNLFISSSPRYAMEAVGIIFIAILAYLLSLNSGNVSQAIPMLGALAIGSQRLLPVIQQAYAAWISLRGGQASLQNVLEFLDQPMPIKTNNADNTVIFQDRIELQHVSFTYQDNLPYVLQDINLSIKKGSRVGFIGTTGGGKSTLLDIIMGLLDPLSGFLAIDGKPISPSNKSGWQSHIAHVPQFIFLADCSVAENIAFGVPKEKINYQRIQDVAAKAQIADTIESWPDKYQTYVGERGVRLSGGQRQRIGIARALYKQADVIIFDEATSALDSETEKDVMKSINALSENLTLLIIAHRLDTLEGCSNIVELNQGVIKKISSYEDIKAG